MSEKTTELTRKELNEQTALHNKEVNERLDKDYDGYYDDIKPKEGRSKVQEFNKETVKKVALIVAGAIIIIAFAILMIVY